MKYVCLASLLLLALAFPLTASSVTVNEESVTLEGSTGKYGYIFFSCCVGDIAQLTVLSASDARLKIDYNDAVSVSDNQTFSARGMIQVVSGTVRWRMTVGLSPKKGLTYKGSVTDSFSAGSKKIGKQLFTDFNPFKEYAIVHLRGSSGYITHDPEVTIKGDCVVSISSKWANSSGIPPMCGLKIVGYNTSVSAKMWTWK